MSRPRLLYPTIAPVVAAALIGAFFTDLAYWRTADMLWQRFSIWLLTAGLIVAAATAIAWVIDVVRDPMARASLANWLFVIANVGVVALSILNVLIHSRDAYTSVVPWGLFLSGIVTVLLLCLVVTYWRDAQREVRP